MDQSHRSKTTAVATCGFLILLLDAALCVGLRAGLVLQDCSTCGLAVAWAFAAVKWAVLYLFTFVAAGGKPQAVLCRLVALLCLLPPVYESGQMFMASPSDPYMGLSPNLSMHLLGLMSSLVACMVWEIDPCGDVGMKKDNKHNARRLLMRLLKYFKPDTLYITAAFGFLILGVVCESFIPMYQGKVIGMLKDQVHPSSFCYVMGQLALVSLGSTLFSALRGGIFKCTLARLNKRLVHLVFHSLLQQEVHFFEKNKPGRLSSCLQSDVERMGRTVALNANVLVRGTVKFAIMLTVMLHLSWELAVPTFIEMLLLAILHTRYINLSMELKDQMQECQAQNKDLALETVSGIRTVRSFNGGTIELKRYNEALDRMCAVKRRTRISGVMFGLLRKLVLLVMKVVLLVQARRLILSDRLSIGSLVSFLLYQKPMSDNLREILYCYTDTLSTVGVISKVFAYLDRTPACKKAGELAPDQLEGRIVFQNVTFTYPSAPEREPALKSVSLELPPGKMTALVGPTGSGKTSCVSLLKRLYEPQGGEILLDGEPLHHYQHRYLHQKIALVSQNPVLFSGSLRSNIEYGLKDCSIEKVKEAAEKAGADDFISKLENGYDADIGECGGVLSGGVKQCIAIVRALVRDPQVIILDEATSKLDVEAQHAVLREVLSCGRTVLMVSHQLKTVERADHIVFLENGAVVEQGTHRELMAKRGRYYRLKEELFSQLG